MARIPGIREYLMPRPTSHNFRPRLEGLERRDLLSTFTVLNINDSGPGSLRQAILDSNATPTQLNTIDFSIDSGVETISLRSALPTITAAMVLDGTTQPGFAGTPLIVLDGGSAGAGVIGLTITAGNSAVEDLVIDNFQGGGIALQIAGDNLIAGNYIGVDGTGAAAGNGGAGIAITGSSSNNTIGGTTASAGNVISGNTADGVFIGGGSTTGNQVLGNYIGTDITGTAAVPNDTGVTLGGGIYILGSPGNVIGGTTSTPGTGPGNLISGNRNAGILILGTTATGNLIEGNLIGTDVSGMSALGNGLSTAFAGIRIAAADNTVGGTATGAGNVVSANGGSGVATSAAGTVVQGNYIGTDVTGTIALGNQVNGVNINDIDIGIGPANNLIGGTGSGAGNVICGSGQNGISVIGSRASGNVIEGNVIGTDLSGALVLGNSGNGVALTGSSGNIVAGNVIAFSGNDGVLVDTGTGNAISQNSIFGNANLGIELLNGGNDSQPAPQLNSAVAGGGVTTVQGTFTGQASTTYTLEFFAADSSGQGQQFLGSMTVTTDETGMAVFSVDLSGEQPVGQLVTATATDPLNNTSAFAQAVAVTG
jgi:hypothetical protein